jgi:hypothetical protein
MNAVVIKSALRRPASSTKHRIAALRIYTALAEMSKASARREEWCEVADSCNIVEALVDLGKYEAEKVNPMLASAKDGLIVAMKCADGQMRMGTEQLLALRHIVTLHDEAIEKFSLATMFEAERRVVATVRRVMAGDEEGVTVVQA